MRLLICSLALLLFACSGTEAGLILSNNAPSTYDSTAGPVVFDLLWASDDANTVNVQGYSFGIEHSITGAVISSIADNSPNVASPDFVQTGLFPNGAVLGTVYSLFNLVDQPVSSTPIPFARVTLDVSGSTGDITFNMVNTVGSPPVNSVYVEGGVNVPMSMTAFTITDATGAGGGGGSVPEPSTAFAIGLLGVVGFAGNRRRRRRAI